MPQNFLFPQRDQPLLLPVDMREWLPEDDVVFVVLDAVAALDLGEFYRSYRADGHGRAAFDPEMMVALLLYGYCQGERSSRVIEKRCVRDVAYRVIAGGLAPDHATIARFRARHEQTLGGLFSQVLRLLGAGGMVSLGLLSLDGTKVAGNAAQKANKTLPQTGKLLAEAAEADAAENALHGSAAGPVTPRALARRAGTTANYGHAVRPARERLGERLVQSITREDIEALRDWMQTAGRKRGGKPGTGLGPRSVRLTISRLSAAFEQAVNDGKLARNPCRGVRLPRMAKRDKVTWSAGKARQFLAVASANRLHAAWRMALYGLRREEICGLRWQDVDLAARTLTIATVRVMVDGKVITKDAPKSERSARTLPLDGALVAALTALRKAQAAEKLAAGQAYRASGYVATDELGAAVHPEWLSDEFERLVKRAGVPRLTLHGWRHTGLSLMEKDGVPISIISRWAGHATPEFTYRVYVHAGQDDLAAGRDALERLYGPAGEAV